MTWRGSAMTVFGQARVAVPYRAWSQRVRRPPVGLTLPRMRAGRSWRDGGVAAAGAAALSGVTLALVVLASSAGSVKPVSGSTAVRTPRVATVPAQQTPTPSGSPGVLQPPTWKPWQIPDWIIAAIQFALAAAVIAGVLLLVRVIVRAIAGVVREIELPEPEETDSSGWQLMTREQLADAVEDGGEAMLATGTPSNAIVGCWLALERAAASAGVNRRPSETPTEFTLRVLGEAEVPAEPLARLADLYREARFSVHGLPESARAEARAALDRLRQALRAGAR